MTPQSHACLSIELRHIGSAYHLFSQPLYNTSNWSIHHLHLILHYHMLSSNARDPSMHEKYSSLVLSVTLCVAAISESSGVKSWVRSIRLVRNSFPGTHTHYYQL